MTREEAVLYLMNLKNCQVNMIVSNLSHGLFTEILPSLNYLILCGRIRAAFVWCWWWLVLHSVRVHDLLNAFHISYDVFSAHFTSKAANDEELSVGINDIFHVTDTLYNGQIGYWVVTKLQSFSPQTKLSGIIPNRAR